MNICLFSIKVLILVKICPTVIEILTFNKWSQRFTVSRRVISYLQSMELTDVSIDTIVALAKQKQTKWCLFSTENLVLIKVLRQEKGYDNR